MIFPALTVICTWTLPKRVWDTEPAKVPLPLPEAAVELVVPVERPVPDVPVPDAAPEVLPVELLPDAPPAAAAVPFVPAEVPMEELPV